MSNPQLWPLLTNALGETLYMVGFSLLFASLGGLPLGVLLIVTAPGHIYPNRYLHNGLALVVNIGRSLPFIILLVAVIPFTRLIAGTSIGTAGAIVPLTLAAIPFLARVVETSLLEVDRSLLEAAQAMGAPTYQVIFRVLLPEAQSGLVLGLTLTALSLVSYSAMAGAIGGGGLGDLAIRYGYQRFQPDVMLATVVVLLLLVQSIQSLGNWLARHVDRG